MKRKASKGWRRRARPSCSWHVQSLDEFGRTTSQETVSVATSETGAMAAWVCDVSEVLQDGVEARIMASRLIPGDNCS